MITVAACPQLRCANVAPTQATATLFEIDPDSPLLTDQRRYMSAVVTAAFAAYRTVPQAKVAVHSCAIRDLAKLMNFEPLLLYSSGGRLVSVTCRVLARR